MISRVIRKKKHLQLVIYLSVHLVTYIISYNRKVSLKTKQSLESPSCCITEVNISMEVLLWNKCWFPACVRFHSIVVEQHFILNTQRTSRWRPVSQGWGKRPPVQILSSSTFSGALASVTLWLWTPINVYPWECSGHYRTIAVPPSWKIRV